MTDYKALAQAMYDSIADRDHMDESIDRYLAEDFVEHTVIPGMGSTTETTREFFRALHGALDGLHVEVHDLLQDGDRVAGRVSFRGVAKDGGKELGAEAMDLFELRGEQCVAHWAAGDLAGLLAEATGGAAAGRRDYKALTREMYDAVIAGGRDGVEDVMDRYLAEDFVEHEAIPGFGTDREAARRLFEAMHEAIPDLQVEFHQVLQDGDEVAAYLTLSGTMMGELMGAPASGEHVRMPVVDVFTFRDDRVVVHSGAADMSELFAPPSAVRS